MAEALIEQRRAQADATARLRGVIQEILGAADPAQEMARLDPALAQTGEGWRDVRRLLVAPLVRERRLEPAIAR